EYQTSIPLTSQSKSESLFFFSVSMNAGFSTEKQVKQYISNVFEISKYKDGTRPYTSTILNELKDLTPYDEVICGYYNTEDEAIVARDNFIKEMQKEHVAFEEFYYAGKPSNMNMQGTNQNNSSANKGYGKVINVDSGHSSEPDIKQTNETPKNENKYGKTISFD
ncbi:MAG TPA: hypothetical protein VKZ44_05235, partial [Taishania sp.]|nr:hypothetical protein [Taishania sp.]